MTISQTLIRLHNVGKDYPNVSSGGARLRTIWSLLAGNSEVPHFRALSEVNLELRRGESFGLIGENGAGKSTLLKVIAGVVKPSVGKIHVTGRIGALLELGSGFHPEYTGRENIFLSAALMGLSNADMADKLDSIIAFADIGEHIEQPLKHYSSGMVVRLGFAVATAMQPDILITDEVLAVGDESFQKKCIRWIEGFLNSGGTLLLCSHSMFHIQTLCQKAAWIHAGKMRMYGDSFEVTREYLTYHEEKYGNKEALLPVPETDGLHPCIKKLWLENVAAEGVAAVEMGGSITINGITYSPDDRPPVVLLGVMRIDGAPVYGTHSNETSFRPNRLQAKLFGFSLLLQNVQLLPGKYKVRAHAMDPEGLRLFDTVETILRVTGKTRDYGLCRLQHEWHEGRNG